MNIRILVLPVLMVTALAGVGELAEAAPQQSAATGDVDASQYMARIDGILALARKGEYGHLKRGSEAKLQAARERIAQVLEGHATTGELRQVDRLALFNAQEAISAILDNRDKDRIVCRREIPLGTRFATTECMSVGEREARGKLAGESVDKLQRAVCVPSETSPCGK